MKRSVATLADDREFAKFCCCPAEAAAWQREPENYVRAHALRRADHVLTLRSDEDELVAVSAFNRSWAEHIPLVEPRRLPAWFLLVIAIRSQDQEKGLSAELFDHTFAAMREIDRTRSLVMARVHRQHRASLETCGKVGLEPLALTDDEEYQDLLGMVPGTADPLGDA
jgi:hypothetical protein